VSSDRSVHGLQPSRGFVARAIGYGGLDFEDDRPGTLAEALAALEAGLVRWFEAQGFDTDDTQLQ
jgi:hypothetical protein